MPKPLRWNNQPCVIVRDYTENGYKYVVVQTLHAPGMHTERVFTVLKSIFDHAQEAKP